MEATATSERQLFFEKVDALKGDKTIFSVMRMSDPDRTLFKILLDGGAQFTAEMVGDNLTKVLREGGRAELLFSGLFTKIKGKITMEEIMHDGLPGNRDMTDFSILHPESAHKEHPAVIFNGGNVSLHLVSPDTVALAITDRNAEGITGVYCLVFTDEKRTDAKARESTVVKMIKIK